MRREFTIFKPSGSDANHSIIPSIDYKPSIVVESSVVVVEISVVIVGSSLVVVADTTKVLMLFHWK